MTGDGVGDARHQGGGPRHRHGQCGARHQAVAQVVLVDSKFSHLPDVVARGRQVMANMERVASLFPRQNRVLPLILARRSADANPIPIPAAPYHVYRRSHHRHACSFWRSRRTRAAIFRDLKRVVTFALPGGIATALSVLLAGLAAAGHGLNVTGDAMTCPPCAPPAPSSTCSRWACSCWPRGQTTQRLAWRAGGGVRGGGVIGAFYVRSWRTSLRPDSPDRRHDGGHADRVGRFRADLRAVPVAGAARARTDQAKALASALRRRRDCLILQADTPEPR